MPQRIYDFIAIGIGPFNLSLACLAEPVTELQGLFLDQRSGFDWHPGMLLPGASMQTPFLADLVTLADPTSRFSFLNYLKQQGRLYPFYIREQFVALRTEFNHYCQWAASQLPTLRWQRQVEALHEDPCGYRLTVRRLDDGSLEHYRTRRLVLGTGTQPVLPACCEGVGSRLVHSADYLANKLRLQMQPSITLLGSGQSAAEIYYDLLQDSDRYGYRLDWITRSPRFFPLEYSKLTLEMTSPDYIDYFHALPGAARDQLIASQASLYKGINRQLIDQIFDLLYQKQSAGAGQTRLITNTALIDCQCLAADAGLRLQLRQCEQGREWTLDSACVIAATGYAYRPPAFLHGIQSRLRYDAAGRLDVTRDYAIDVRGDEIYVQNVGLYTHGLATPDLGMVCYRNASLLRSLCGREIYPLEQRIAFQSFGVDDDWLPTPAACVA